MSVIVTAGDRMEIRAYVKDGEQTSVNTIFYRVVAVTGVVTDDDFATAFDSVISGPLKNLIWDGALYQGVSVRVANRLPLPVAALNNGGAGSGVGGTIGLPRQTCGLVDFRTPIAGPGGRGRWYMPFPSADFNEAQGIPKNTYVADLSAFGQMLLDVVLIGAVVGGGSADVAFTLWSRKHASMRAITATFGSTRWATLRSRGSYGRANTGPF